jgi:hypothetical protein
MDVVALSTDYPCRIGGPVLSSVDRRIFSLRYFQACMSCSFCHDSCCQHGVDIDLENVVRLKSVHGRFAELVGVPQTEWFTDTVIADPEFPSGQHVRTQVRDGACVFLDRKARGCLIHRFALEEGLDYHTLKPMVSILFPLTFNHGLLHASAEALDGTLVCSGEGPSCYEGAREELRYYFGDALILELDALQNG